jgi:hypothetical protein
MGKISGSKAKCRWFNPSDEKVFEIGAYPVSGLRSYTPPSEGDWVIVIDNLDAKLPSPGSESLIKQ